MKVEVKREISITMWAEKAKPRNGETKSIQIQYAKILLCLSKGSSE